jgi:hypothetical protein
MARREWKQIPLTQFVCRDGGRRDEKLKSLKKEVAAVLDVLIDVRKWIINAH